MRYNKCPKQCLKCILAVANMHYPRYGSDGYLRRYPSQIWAEGAGDKNYWLCTKQPCWCGAYIGNDGKKRNFFWSLIAFIIKVSFCHAEKKGVDYWRSHYIVCVRKNSVSRDGLLGILISILLNSWWSREGLISL